MKAISIKKLIAAITAISVCAALFAGCTSKPQTTPSPSEAPEASASPTPETPSVSYATAEEFLAAVIGTFGEEYPISDTLNLLGNENISNYLGLTADEISEYVQEAYVSVAMMMTSPHQIAVIKLKDASQAQAAADAMESGFDPHKWICVVPEMCQTVISGEYVFLAAGSLQIENAVTALTGTETKASIFYTKEGDAGGGLSFGDDVEGDDVELPPIE